MLNKYSSSRDTCVEIVEVGPRDGFQPIGPWIETQKKIDIIRQLATAGLKRMEITSFVSPSAVPQMRDAGEVLVATGDIADVSMQVLVPSARRGREALDAGATHIAYVVSASEAHNENNVRRSVASSIADYREFVRDLDAGIRLRFNLATSFDCPFTGRTEIGRVIEILGETIPAREDVEICLCDTTGRADPNHVGALFEKASRSFPAVEHWAFHGHDTYGLGVANVYSAYSAGVRVIDAAVGGLGGCPFAPGATGNVATEDVVWMFERMGVPMGIDIEALLSVAELAASIPGANSGGRARTALRAVRSSETKPISLKNAGSHNG
jgi:hydroxymethylglutaryl-CoA lyase